MPDPGDVTGREDGTGAPQTGGGGVIPDDGLKSAGDELEDGVDGEVQNDRNNAGASEPAEKEYWRSIWDSFHDSSRYFRQLIGAAGTLVAFADYCTQNGCIDEGWNFYQDPAFWLSVGQVANEELWASLMSIAGVGVGASFGLWAGVAVGGGVASVPAGAIGLVFGGVAGAGLGALGGGLLGQNMNAGLGLWSRERGWVD